jgi:hypothetical protein
MNGSPYVAVQGLETAPLETGAVLYHPQSKKFIMLNRSAALIWNELSTPQTHEQLLRKICSAYPDANASTAENDLNAALDQLKILQLVSGGN